MYDIKFIGDWENKDQLLNIPYITNEDNSLKEGYFVDITRDIDEIEDFCDCVYDIFKEVKVYFDFKNTIVLLWKE